MNNTNNTGADPGEGNGDDAGSSAKRGGGVLGQMEDLSAQFDSLVARLDELPPAGAFEALEFLEVLHRKIGAVRGRVMARAKDSQLWAAQGARSFNSWASTRLGGDPSEVGRTVRDAAQVRDHLPLMEAALAQGSVSPGHVSAMVRSVLATDKHLEALKNPEAGEAFLVEQAQIQTVPKFRRLVATWANYVDPDRADERALKETAEEYLVLAETLGGYHLQGFLSPVNGKLVSEAITAAIGITPEGDTRTLPEKNADGLIELANTVLSSGSLLKNSVVRPHLSVTVEYDTLTRMLNTTSHNRAGRKSSEQGQGDGEVGENNETNDAAATGAGGSLFDLDKQPCLPVNGAGGGVILTPRQLAFLACDSTVTRIVFGPESEVMDVGRSRRVVSSQQRRAVEARDRHCQFPGCEAHTNTSEIHHVKHWAAGGQTSVENSILLCRFHHQHVHMRNITIRRRKSRTPGHKWAFYTPDGQLINNRPQHKRIE